MQKELILFLDPYLAQWWKHSLGGDEPVNLPKVAVERKYIVANAVVTDYNQDIDNKIEEGMESVRIALPRSLVQPPGKIVFLKKKARNNLAEMIRNSFDIDLWNDVHDYRNVGVEQKKIIEAWMELHDVEITDKNFNAVIKRYQRLRKAYLSNMRVKKFRQKRKS
ncbi:MAG: hypothetical protein K2M31_07780 [Muribaculaceae bacterium]|nr:hypothetical protein [Muribaculaceae bacterium]